MEHAANCFARLVQELHSCRPRVRRCVRDLVLGAVG